MSSIKSTEAPVGGYERWCIVQICWVGNVDKLSELMSDSLNVREAEDVESAIFTSRLFLPSPTLWFIHLHNLDCRSYSIKFVSLNWASENCFELIILKLRAGILNLASGISICVLLLSFTSSLSWWMLHWISQFFSHWYLSCTLWFKFIWFLFKSHHPGDCISICF